MSGNDVTRGDLTPEERTQSDELLHRALAGGKLPRWAPAAAGAGALVLALVLNVLTPVDGVAGTLVVAVLVFVIAQTAWSFGVEGRRHAFDRLATTGVYATFLIALAPLIAVLATVVVKGAQVISVNFLMTSMRNVDPNSTSGGVYHALIGTLEQVGIAALIGVPLGVLTAVYLVEYAPDAKNRMASRSGRSTCRASSPAPPRARGRRPRRCYYGRSTSTRSRARRSRPSSGTSSTPYPGRGGPRLGRCARRAAAPRSVTAFIGPSGLRQVDRAARRSTGCTRSHAPGGARCLRRGQGLLDGEDIYGADVDPVDVRRTIGMVFQRPNPFPTMSIYDNVAPA
jgi:hypothetical protein